MHSTLAAHHIPGIKQMHSECSPIMVYNATAAPRGRIALNSANSRAVQERPSGSGDSSSTKKVHSAVVAKADSGMKQAHS